MTVIFSSLRIDVDAIEHGAWVGEIPEMNDLRLKVRGVDSAAWRRVESNEIRKARGKGVDRDNIVSVCLRDAAVLEWAGLAESGAPLQFSHELASKLLFDPEFRAFRDAALWAASKVGQPEIRMVG